MAVISITIPAMQSRSQSHKVQVPAPASTLPSAHDNCCLPSYCDFDLPLCFTSFPLLYLQHISFPS
ncbi:MAG: hypothetical protein KH366_07905 [Clostridiaceae bacterium]|nr:hypothetical protein [Clostridiaceae bacterium]